MNLDKTFLEKRWEREEGMTREEKIAELEQDLRRAETDNDEIRYNDLTKRLERLKGTEAVEPKEVAHVSGSQEAATKRNEEGNIVYESSAILRREHMDRNGHLNYYHWIEALHDAHIDALEECGVDFIESLEGRGVRMFVAKNEFEYKKDAKAGQEFKIKTSFKTGNTSIKITQEVLVDGERAGTAQWVIVAVDSEGKPTPIPEEMKKKINH